MDKRVLNVNDIDNERGGTQRVIQVNSIDNKRGVTQRVVVVGGGVEPTGTLSITANGVYDVTDYASADVQVPTSNITRYGSDVRAFLGEIDENGILQKPTTPQFDLVFTGVKGFTSYSADAGVLFRRFQNLETIKSVSFPDLETINTAYAMANCFYGCKGITSVDLSSLQTISAQQGLGYTFSGCTSLTSVDMGSVTSISGANAVTQCFYGCTSLTSVDLHSLTTLSGNSGSVFYGTTALESLDLPALTTLGEGASLFRNSGIKSINLKNLTSISAGNNYGGATLFKGCSNLEKIKFESLNNMGNYGNWSPGQFFGQCTSLTEVWFYAAKSYPTFNNATNSTFANWLVDCTGVTVHFPKEAQTKLTTFSNVTSGLGGTNTTVLFDIITTIRVGSSTYLYRKESESTTTAIAWNYSGTLYYTAGTTDPAVGDTVYSDAACTTVYGTIETIS